MTDFEFNQLSKTALELRILLLNSIFLAKSGHPGGSLSAIDVLTFLYFKILNVDPNNPNSPSRDRFVLSKGHAAPALYSVLALKGFFNLEDLKTLRKKDSFLQGHPNLKSTPGVDMTTGSLGQGISAACGMALGLKLSNLNSRVFCLLGDGEIEEGQVWEAALFASHNNLNNLTLMVDNNGLQIDGKIEDVAGMKNIADKFSAFGFETFEINGHDFHQMETAFNEAFKVKNKPTVIVLKTVKGKGVSFMEDEVSWHGKAPNEAELNSAVIELNNKINCLEV